MSEVCSRRSWLGMGALAAAGMVAPVAWAGQDCGERAPATPQRLAAGAALGARVVRHLEASGASLALVARIGLDLSEFGQRYTHMGLAWRDAARQRWRTMHLMNACGSSASELLEQPAENFYETQLFADEAQLLVPGYATQVKLLRAFLGPLAQRMHERNYNLIAHPFDVKFQNSNQWLLEVMAAGLMARPAVTRREAQAWLQQRGYEPGSIRIPNLKRSAARLFSPHVHFTDHTQQEYEQQRYLVVTVDSIAAFLRRIDPELAVATVS